MEGVRTQLVDNVPVIQLRQGMIIVSLIIIVLPGEPVVPPRVEEVEGEVAEHAMDSQIREIVVLPMNAGRLKGAISKKAVGGATMGDGTALAIAPGVGQPVHRLAATASKPMAVEPPEIAVTDRVVLP